MVDDDNITGNLIVLVVSNTARIAQDGQFLPIHTGHFQTIFKTVEKCNGKIQFVSLGVRPLRAILTVKV